MSGGSEIWLPVVDYEDVYRVSSLGRIYSVPRPRTKGGLLAVKIGKRGYPAVTLVREGRQVTREVHLLVAAAFLGPRPPGTEVRHDDGNSLNPNASNLLYGTRSENNRDAVRHGTHPKTRKTHCPQGHPYDDANTMLYRGHRYCRACHNARSSRARRHPDYDPEWASGS
jgi:hypothetical protein